MGIGGTKAGATQEVGPFGRTQGKRARPLQRLEKSGVLGRFLQLIAGGHGSWKTADGGGFRLVNVEYGEQLGQLHDFVEFLAEIAEAYGGAGIFGAEMSGDQSTKARTVDIIDFGHVQNDLLLTTGDEALEFLAEGSTLFAQNDAAIQGHQGDAIHFAAGDF
jgi:hypothetical protein